MTIVEKIYYVMLAGALTAIVATILSAFSMWSLVQVDSRVRELNELLNERTARFNSIQQQLDALQAELDRNTRLTEANGSH